MATSFVLRSEVSSLCRILHIDTTDRRGLANIGRFDAGNVVLAVRHCARMVAALLTRWPAAVYVPIAQNRLGLLRDAALVLPALLLRRSVVLHLHGSELRAFYEDTDPLMRALLRLMLRRAARIIVLGNALRPLLDGLAEPDRVTVVPNGVDDGFGRRPARRREATPLRVLYLANVRRAKGYHVAIEAVTALLRRGLDVELHVAGDFSSASDRNDVLRSVQPLGAAAHVHGMVEGAQKRALLESADVFVLPSFSEGHPYVLLEAMAAGLPIVASALPAIAETVSDGESALLVPAGDVGAVAAALQRLAQDADLRQRLGAAARARYEEGYSFEIWSKRMAGVFSEVLA